MEIQEKVVVEFSAEEWKALASMGPSLSTHRGSPSHEAERLVLGVIRRVAGERGKERLKGSQEYLTQLLLDPNRRYSAEVMTRPDGWGSR